MIIPKANEKTLLKELYPFSYKAIDPQNFQKVIF